MSNYAKYQWRPQVYTGVRDGEVARNYLIEEITLNESPAGRKGTSPVDVWRDLSRPWF